MTLFDSDGKEAAERLREIMSEALPSSLSLSSSFGGGGGGTNGYELA